MQASDDGEAGTVGARVAARPSPARAMESALERGLFASRWLLVPMYVGLALSMLFLVWVFLEEFWHVLVDLARLESSDVILGALELIDLTLAANLVLIVIFSGYENFVSKMEVDGHVDQPDWKGKVDFSALKMKLISSMVAISGIQLLKVFLQIGEYTREHIILLIAVHLVFVVSGVLLALMDLLSARADAMKTH